MKAVNRSLISFLIFTFISISIFAQSGTPALQYLGNAFVKLTTSEGKVIYIDPYAVTETDSADIILITHEHDDHNDLTKVTPKTDCKIIRAADAIKDGAYQNFTIGNVNIISVPAYNKYHPKSDGVGFIVEFDGVKVYHAGGTSKIYEMNDLKKENIDYALYPLTAGPEEMTLAAALVQAAHDIPIHSNVSLQRNVNQGYINRFISPNKLVLVNDQTIDLVHENAPAAGSIIKVPADYPSIQSAIDASQNGDTVLVSEGTYFENINFKGKSIVVTSNYIFTNNWETVQKTIIDGSKCTNKDTASTVQFLNKEDSTAAIIGFTITGGSGTKYNFPNGTGTNSYQEGGGIVLHYSSAVIKNNIICGNVIEPASSSVKNGGGGGIASMYGSPSIYDNMIYSNTGGYAGGIVLNWSGGKVRNNLVYNNIGGKDYGTGGIMIWKVPANSVWVENNTVVGNVSLKDAGGINIKIENNAVPVVKNNLVWGNRQVTGPQVLSAEYSQYNLIEDYSESKNFSNDPLLSIKTFLPQNLSPCVDAGDPGVYYLDWMDDVNPAQARIPSSGGTRNDVGITGGEYSITFPSINVYSLYTTNKLHSFVGNTSDEGVYKFELLNQSSVPVDIDSLTIDDNSIFRVTSNQLESTGRLSLDMLEHDTIKVYYKSLVNGKFRDTVKIYHNAVGVENPLKVPIILNAITTDVEEESNLPSDFKLYQNHPNPFNPSTTIGYQVPSADVLGAREAHVTLKVYDILGREVDTLVDKEMNPGIYKITWTPDQYVSSGVYIVNLSANGFFSSKKMIFQK